MGYPRYTRSYCIHLYWLDFLLLSRIGDGWIPHKTSDVGVPQQHHETVHELPPEEDGRLLSIRLALINRFILKEKKKRKKKGKRKKRKQRNKK